MRTGPFRRRSAVVSAFVGGTALAIAAAAYSLSPRDGVSGGFAECTIRGYPLYCSDLESGGVVISTSPGPNAKQIVVMDLGGPGADVRNQLWSLVRISSMNEGTMAFAFLEPWFAVPPTAECAAAGSDLMVAIRESGATVTDAVLTHSKSYVDTCGTEIDRAKQFADERIQFVAELRERFGANHGEDPRVFYVGWSFAAVRLARLVERYPDSVDAAILISPVDPIASIQDSLTKRASEINATLTRVFEGLCNKDARPLCGLDLNRILEESRRLLPLDIKGRSVPLTTFDVAAAILGASYNINDNASWLYDGLSGMLESASDERTALLASVADRVMGRYGVNEVYPGVIGYWPEYCLSTRSEEPFSESLAAGSDSRFEKALFILHAPCMGIPDAIAAASARAENVCVIVDPNDPLAVEPRDAMRLWGPSTGIIVLEGRGHAIGLGDKEVLDAVRRALSASPGPRGGGVSEQARFCEES